MKQPNYRQIPTVYYFAVETDEGLQAARIRGRSINSAKLKLFEKIGAVNCFQVNSTWKSENLPDGTPYIITLI